MPLGRRSKCATDQFDDLVFGDLAGAEGVDHQRGRLGDADGVAHLHQALVGQARGDDVLRHIASGIGGRTVDLGRVLAGECAAAVRGRAAVGVDDDLAAGQAGVAHRPADHETPGRVDQIARVGGEHGLRQHRLDDLLDHRLGQHGVRDFRVMLGREHDGVDGMRLAVDVADRHLRLGVRAQPRQAAVLAQLGLALGQAVREMDRHRHQHGGFVAGIAEHQPLVAGALVEEHALAFVHALRDVGRLLADGDQHRAGVVVEADLGRVVADALDGLARDLVVVDHRRGGDFAGDDAQTGGQQRLARHARMFVLG